MASVSLNAVGSALSKTGAVTLRGTVENGYTRTHAGSGYARINPFEVAAGRAPSGFVAPFSLTDWESYQHATVPAGSNLAAADAYGKISVSWSQPSGYSNDPSNLTQRIYWKDAGTVLDESATATDPFTSPTGSADAGDGTSYDITGLTPGHYYAIGLKVEWNDSLTTRASLGASAAAGETALTGAGTGILGGPVWADSPTINSVTQLTDPNTCYVGGTNNVTVRISFTMQGTSQGTLQERVDSGAWATVDSGIPAGSSSADLTRSDGHLYEYRMKYNAVSPETWSSVLGVTTQCNLL